MVVALKGAIAVLKYQLTLLITLRAIRLLPCMQQKAFYSN